MTISSDPAEVLELVIVVGLVAGGFSIVMWIGITSLLGALAGWFTLQRRYSARDADPTVTLHMQSGRMGAGVQLRNCLTLTAGPAGLGLSMWRILGWRQRPLLIPWREIATAPDAGLLGQYTRLGFGDPEIGHLQIATRTWEQLSGFAENGR